MGVVSQASAASHEGKDRALKRLIRADSWEWSGPHIDAEGPHGELILRSDDGVTMWAPLTADELLEYAGELEELAWAIEDARQARAGESISEHDRKESERTW